MESATIPSSSNLNMRELRLPMKSADYSIIKTHKGHSFLSAVALDSVDLATL